LHSPGLISPPPVQRDYTRKQELIVFALTIVLIVLSLLAFYLFWVKANGGL
jgi:hypothetical protein